ncbi:prefoldin subunit beta [Candidatus Bathyarchaeota archaeon]|nr:prefoldin subunit beta [Candidatus Bathyarchaeota archaeon]MCK5625401.1 prefoldin subunit beta [Candidatus Bathyarchaeota archaeon]
MSNVKLPAQLQEQLLRLQQLQQTLQAVIAQKQQLNLENSEIDQALDELVKMDDKSVIYKSIGSLLVKSERQKVMGELSERKELLNTRILVLTKQRSRMEERMKSLQRTVQERLQPLS